MRTAVLYARFSSDLQKDRSIDDQFALCRQYAAREGFRVIGEYADRAKTSATLFDRDGLINLMTESKAGKFDAVIVESLDRISRDLADLALVFKKLRFNKIDMVTVSDGVASDVSVGLRGIVGQMFMKDLAAKVKRGHDGRVRQGLFPGAVAYGYDRIPGKPGERVINEDQAKVIRRIFTEYAQGVTPREIAKGLDEDGIPTPLGGKHWNHQGLAGGGKNGLLGNRLYIGEIVWNKHHEVLDPETGKATRRESPAEGVLTVPVPHLRIVPQSLWDAAQAVRNGRAVAKFGPEGKVTMRGKTGPRNRHLLSGLLRCSACGSHMIVRTSKRDRTFVVCAAAHQHSSCPHRKSYDIDVIKDAVIEGVVLRLSNPERIKKAARATVAERQALERKNRGERLEIQKKLSRATLARDRLVVAITDSDEPVPILMTKLKGIEAERIGLEERLRLLDAETNGGDRQSAEAAAADAEQMRDALVNRPDDPETRVNFQNWIDTVVVHPTAKGEAYEFSVYRRKGINLFPAMRSGEQIVTEEGCRDVTIPALSRIATYRQGNRAGIVYLGRWKAA